ncbi:MAG: prepilin peptidase [Massilia sp.]|nr:prepilin peptidase [Massilia sp.]
MNEQDAFLELTRMLVTDPRTVVLFTLLIVAAVSDVRHQRIPNWLTLSGLAFGLLYSAFVPFWGHHGFLWALAGAGVGFGVLFPMWLLRLTGAGDVKLMAMTGALLGLQGMWPALVGSIVAGGLFALLLSLWRGKLGTMLGNVGRMLHLGSVALAAGIAVNPATTGWQSVGRLPFGLPIAVGTIVTVIANQFGFL